MDTFLQGIKELSQVPEIQTIFKLILIVFLSGFVGFERESWNKPAGFRTHVLVGISAVLVMVCGEYLYKITGADQTRIPAQLLSGIGFIGAGTILRDGFNVKGLTTAAGLLAVTCVGLAVGAGDYLDAIIATAVVYAVLSYSHIISGKLEHSSILDLEVSVTENPKDILNNIKEVIDDNGLELIKMKIDTSKNNSNIIRITTRYKEKTDINKVISEIMKMEKVNEVEEI